MKMNLNNELLATSNGRFYEFYTWDDLSKTEQNEQLEYANYNDDDPGELHTGQFVRTTRRVYFLDDFMSTDSSWVRLPEYNEHGIHGVLYNDYTTWIEISDDNYYRLWYVRPIE